MNSRRGSSWRGIEIAERMEIMETSGSPRGVLEMEEKDEKDEEEAKESSGKEWEE